MTQREMVVSYLINQVYNNVADVYESLFCFRTCFTPSVAVGPSHNLGKVTHSFFKKPTTIPDCSLTLEEIAQ